MIPHFLLTGAGFSHNWGGYLAKEAFDYLLGVTEHDEDLRRVLWADQAKGWGFETTLARLRKEYEENYSPQVEQDFQNMTSAVRRMFGDMWLAFSQSTFDNQFDDKRLGVIRFLTRFDAIFTLNQDTLLETHYLPVVGQEDFARNTYQGPRYVSAYRPGLVDAHDRLTFGSVQSNIPLYKAGEDFCAVPNLQPYFKLHGSIDIQDGRNMMLILGGDKESDIAKHPLLQAYHSQFRLHLNTPRARLMVIGYSFADAHINKIIFDAVENGLRLFLVGPDGATTIGANKSFPLNPGQQIKDAIVGASSRPLRSTLSGNDMVELTKIERFFQDGRMAISYLSPTIRGAKMSDEPNIVKWPGWEELDKRFEPYALQLGWLAYSWNALHDKLGQLFWTLTGLDNGKIPLAIWNAVKNDRTQRELVRATAHEATTPEIFAEVKWILDRADEFEEHRNNAMHSPLTFMIDFDGPQLSSKWLSGNQRAMKLKGKDLLTEFAWYGRSANALGIYVQRINMHLKGGDQFPLPERPKLPTRGD